MMASDVGSDLLDVVAAVARMAQDILRLRARIVLLEKANTDLMEDVTSARSELLELQKANDAHS
ncbi:MAG: hypothetical protein V2A73_12240 [Pseudomonadota bacterium]